MVRLRKVNTPEQIRQGSMRLGLKARMIGLIGLLIAAVLLVLGIFLHDFLTEALKEQVGEQALSVAESIALDPEIAAAFSESDPAAVIQPLVTPVQQATGAEFIVVGNAQEIRYSHPNPEQIGKRMVGEDNERALLYGESYVSEATGSLGNSLRAKVPVSSEGTVIGVVSVGFLADDIQTFIGSYRKELWFVLFLIGAVAIGAAIGIATYIKRLLRGLEPEEISRLLFHKELILQSTHEGIIAVDRSGNITMLNQMARQLLFGKNTAEEQGIGEAIQNVLPASDLPRILETEESHFDKETVYGEHVVYVNSRPIYDAGTIVGAVSTFRSKTEIDKLTKELFHIRQYANALRAQTHEFSNKLYTISGLLQLDRQDEVLDFVHRENGVQQEWIQQLIGNVSDPLVSGLLIGKSNQASEQHVRLSIDPASKLTAPLSDRQKQALLTAVGNLIDNALDAVKERPKEKRSVSLYFTDDGDDILFEIDDSGEGVSGDSAARLFEEGMSSKEGADRGYGLSTTKRLLALAGGEIHLEESELGGACFVVSMPKEGNGE